MRDMTAHTVYVFLSLFPAEDWVKQYHEMYHSAFVLGICEFNNLEIVSLALFFRSDTETGATEHKT